MNPTIRMNFPVLRLAPPSHVPGLHRPVPIKQVDQINMQRIPKKKKKEKRKLYVPLPLAFKTIFIPQHGIEC